jgi:hypothetical protein
VTVCDFLWSVCGVRGAVCRVVCGVRAAVCVQLCLQSAQLSRLCGMSCGRAGLVCCMLRWSLRRAMRGLLPCAVLGDTRLDVYIMLCRVGLVAVAVFHKLPLL